MEEDEKKFIYTYPAGGQEETRQIRQEYLRPEENKMEQLRKLDEGATEKGMAVSLALGIANALFLDIGICCTMVWADTVFIPSIGIGLLGVAGVEALFPLYRCIIKRQREELVPRIMELTNELTKRKHQHNKSENKKGSNMKKIDLSQGNIRKLVIRTTVPMVVARFVSILYNTVDRIFVGRISEIGTVALDGICFLYTSPSP